MSPVTGSPAFSWAEEFEHSEALDAVMATLSTMHELNAAVGTFLQVHAIVDTNIIYADILALVRKADNGRMRPAILELLAKRTIIGYFPREKLGEVHEKCLELSSRYEIAPKVVTDLWVNYQKHLKIVPTLALERKRPDSQTLAARDPTDLPFLQACHIVGASVVLSNDFDLHASGAPVMPWSRVLLDLRHHSRKEGLKAAIFVGTTTAIVVPIAALIGCVRLIYTAAKKVPPNGWMFAAAGFGIALLIPQSRKSLIESGKAALTGLKKLGAKAGPFVRDALEVATIAGQEADKTRPALEKKLARAFSRRITLTQAVYRACLLANRPLTVSEVWAAAARHGAKSKAKAPLAYVLRALKRHPLLRCLPDGRWEIVPNITAS